MNKNVSIAAIAVSILACNSGYEPVSAQDTGVISPNLIDEDFPLGRSPIRTESFSACVSDIHHSTAQFFNTGSPCIDGMVALIHGRGCDELVYMTDADGVHHVSCGTEASCDLVHRDAYIAVPNDMDWNAYGTHEQIICQDRNVSLLYQVRTRSIPTILGPGLLGDTAGFDAVDTGF